MSVEGVRLHIFFSGGATNRITTDDFVEARWICRAAGKENIMGIALSTDMTLPWSLGCR